MSVAIDSRAEQLAQEAEKLPAFSGLNLLHIKSGVADMLSLIGRGGFFAEYTKHDISHIDRMLSHVEWLIPDSTWRLLTPADALLQVLAIYLHDVGMLITEDEYEQRDLAAFEQFRTSLFDGRDGDDYRAKVLALGDGKADRFLYQELVRMHHGERARAWITGVPSVHMGVARASMAEIAKLLDPLPAALKDDLGLVCESHHRDDLDDVDRYLVSKPYGASSEETANVQYAALVLRTADLLHVTADRTPSTLFRLIAPSDPVSQQEWAKQRAVTSIRSKPSVDSEGNIDLAAPRDTVEVFAEFTDEGGFFGLTEYLAYASQQLRQSAEWASSSQRRHGSQYELPWRAIYDGNIQTKGFLRDRFEFTLDQARVLDLLTGHTLYNNSDVVIRELVQNSLDAVRLQAMSAEPGWVGRVEISWDSASRTLCVLDNGTGMTQSVIENHLLKVGSSLYQDPEFKRQHPEFSPISRFGIGVLSAFMIADKVTVVTTHDSEDDGRQLSLRSVHGRYLIRLVDKKELGAKGHFNASHGTAIHLQLRPSATLEDVEKILRYWVVVPRCSVLLTVDGGEPVEIGYETPKAALEAWVGDGGWDLLDDAAAEREQPDSGDVRVVEDECDGVTLAFALRWSDHFKEWSFVIVQNREERPLGLCVEGIRVDGSTPGFADTTIVAIANAVGQGAPRTNVARSTFEKSDERTRAFERVYAMYVRAAALELERLRVEQRFSLTWAAQEARWIAGPLLGRTAHEKGLLKRALATLPAVVVDEGEERRLSSARELREIPSFWTVHSGFYQSADSLLREMPTTVSVQALSRALGIEVPALDGIVVTGSRFDNVLMASAFDTKEVARIRLWRTERRADIEWHARGDLPIWLVARPELQRFPELRRRLETPGSLDFDARRRREGGPEVFVPETAVQVQGAVDEIAVKLPDGIYLLPGTALVDYVRASIERTEEEKTAGALIAQMFVADIVDGLMRNGTSGTFEQSAMREYLEDNIMSGLGHPNLRREDVTEHLDLDAFAEALAAQRWVIFDPYSWNRKD